MFRKILTALCAALVGVNIYAQGIDKSEFTELADSLTVLLKERTGVTSEVKIERIREKGGTLDFYFTTELGDYPWYGDDAVWFKREISNLLPEEYRGRKVGEVFVKRRALKHYLTPRLGNDGLPDKFQHRSDSPRRGSFVSRVGSIPTGLGMEGRHIALWASHGKVYNEKEDRWKWQRAPLHTTAEDLFTSGFVIPFLIPMLENAGAYVITPRERDIQVNEIIIDNDKAFADERDGLTRKSGKYMEIGKWSQGGTGFADKKKHYSLGETPFKMGTYRMVSVTGKGKSTASAVWEAQVEERGRYAVYVSYASLPNSSECAHYSINHLGGVSEFIVNQKIAGGTWVYLGTFEMDGNSSVVLDNAVAPGYRFVQGSVVTADAVKIGGGIGKYERGGKTSGLPSFAEGALYWEQWAGSDDSITEKWEDDYTKDFAGRGAWTTMMKEEKHIPIDISLAFHSDANSTPNDSIIGTLGIYTLVCDNSTTYPDGGNRFAARSYTDLVQTQVVEDIRENYEPLWERRETWDRSYSECRTTSVPGMILETMSHQNFADMKYGLDPSFRFSVSRSVYKGMLKFLSNRYGTRYVVQPLPVNSMAVRIGDGIARIMWKPTEDASEPTAGAQGFILQTREGYGAFDEGRILEGKELKKQDGFFYTEVPIKGGRIYSFKIVAFNDGGKSFPSETVCLGLPGGSDSWNERDNTVMVVNNFDRISAPAWFDTPDYAGFDRSLDSGVGYMYDITYIGENYQKRRDLEWIDDFNPGFGASYTNWAGRVIPGNTFDFAYVHGRALLDAGYAFYSVSRDAWCSDESLDCNAFAVDMICGKQVTTMSGRGAVPNKYKVYPDALQEALKKFTGRGGNVIVSGAHIGVDVWDRIYPYAIDSLKRESDIGFVEEVLGYRWCTSFASPEGTAYSGDDRYEFYNELNEKVYCAENVDGLIPASRKGKTVMKYVGNDVPAAVLFDSGNYMALSVGFPLETLKDTRRISDILGGALKQFRKK